MTIAALHRLLNEIDDQGGPTAARHNRLHFPDPEGTPEPMTTIASPTHTIAGLTLPTAPQPAEPQPIPVGQLLKWGDEHDDPEVQDQAARARAALTGLRRRHAADQELAAITSEEEQLAQRLAEIQARKAELTPAKAKKQRKAVDYPAAEVRAWAKANGVDCPPFGRVPKAVVDAWRAARPEAG
ncbi:histone-like nucleoid-structuring protein Lsr2 [Streptomyces sp. NPDC006355]|uniref:Lsr2 family DNA-binding protein n=1 Tax=Streptomyces sp. NPDC006355 TaxID=3156758 RepID=UPI0033BA1073